MRLRLSPSNACTRCTFQMRNVNLSCVRTCMVVAEERPRIALTQSFSKIFKDLGLSARAVSTTFGCRVNVAVCLQVRAGRGGRRFTSLCQETSQPSPGLLSRSTEGHENEGFLLRKGIGLVYLFTRLLRQTYLVEVLLFFAILRYTCFRNVLSTKNNFCSLERVVEMMCLTR